MNRLSVIALLALFLQPLPALAVTPYDFASGFSLRLETDQAALYELELPLAAYVATTRSDLGDFRVFNAADAVVPAQLLPPSPPASTSIRTRSLPFFPLPNDHPDTVAELALHVVRNDAGTIVDLRTDGPMPATSPAAWLLDTGAENSGRGRALTLHLAATGAGALGEVRIDDSDNLRDWQPLQRATVAALLFAGKQLEQSRIELARPPRRYLRVSWPAALAPLTLQAIDFDLESDQHRLPDLQHLSLQGRRSEAAAPRFDYLLPGPLPLTRIKLRPAPGNSLAACTLQSAATADGPWRHQWRGLVWRVERDSHILSTPTFTVPTVRHRYWRLDCANSEAGLTEPPALEVDWRPDRLRFLAQGAPPYQLAIGNSSIAPARFPLDRLVAAELTPATATPLDARPLGGAARRQPAPQPLPWKQIALWTLLSTGVLLVALLAWSLHRQLRSGASPPGSDDIDA